jgi:omega-6 fatty acid desaturase (delta-12 desaturase)
MTADLPVRPEITPGYRREADREIRAFTRDWTPAMTASRRSAISAPSRPTSSPSGWRCRRGPSGGSWCRLSSSTPSRACVFTCCSMIAGTARSTARNAANDLAGYGLSVFTLTPYRVMQFNHNEHHSHLGNLEERETTEIFTMTLREWEETDLVDAAEIPALPQPAPHDPRGRASDLCLDLSLAEERRSHRCGGCDPAQYRPRPLGRGDLVDGRYPGPRHLRRYGLHRGRASASFSSTCSTISRTPGGTESPSSTPPARRCRAHRRSISAGGGISAPVISPITTSTISTPISRPTGCANATARCAKNYQVQTIRWPEAIRSFTLKLWDEDQERLVPFPRERRTAPLPEQRLRVSYDPPLHPGRKTPARSAPVPGHRAQVSTALRTMSQ